MNPRMIKSTIIDVKRSLDRRRSVIGVVEALGFTSIKGWVVVRNSELRNIVISVQGRDYRPAVSWSERADIARDHNCYGDLNGFEARIPRELRNQLSRNPDLLSRIKVKVNGKNLRKFRHANIEKPFKVSSHQRAQPIKAHKLGKAETDCGQLNLGLLGVEAFVIYGWWCGPNKAIHELGLDLKGQYLPSASSVDAVKRSDIPKSLSLSSVPNEAKFFELELPGYLWQALSPGESCAFQLVVNSSHRLESIITLQSQQIIDWLIDIASGVYGADEYWQILALEHLHFLHPKLNIGKELTAYYNDLAGQLGLGGYVNITEQAAPVVARAAEESLYTPLSHFNETLLLNDRSPTVVLDEIIERFNLEGERLNDFLLLLVPFFCASGDFLLLESRFESLDLSKLESDNAWDCSRALPFIFSAGDDEALIVSMGRISGLEGWINTECVLYVLSSLLNSPGRPRDIEKSEKIVVTFLALINSMNGDYWSRLHDRYLYLGLIECIKVHDRFNDRLRQSIFTTAISCFGLSAFFWRDLEHALDRNGVPEILVKGGEYFGRLKEIVSDRKLWLSGFSELLEIVTYFTRSGNPDGVVWLRDFLVNILEYEQSPEFPRSLFSVACNYLLSINSYDVIRLSSAPAGRNSGDSNNLFEGVRPALRQLIDVGKRAPRYELQLELGRLLLSLREALATGVDSEELLDDLLTKAKSINNRASEYLYIDILGIVINLLGEEAGLQRDALLDNYEHALSGTYEKMEGRRWPGATLVCSHLRVRNSIPLTRLSDFDARTAHIASNFQAENDRSLSSLPMEKVSKGLGIFSDTLIIIYSCQKNLEDRIPALRNSWIRELCNYGVDYLVVVGDGDDQVQGDVLALDVSDVYEDLPQKTLKLVEWVYSNTDYQYLIKIDDDCFLNVDQYFGSMTYRKFHYYGRRLSKGRGGINRQWHQGKSTSLKAKLSLDKSPDYSIYADGGTGYSLSRLAMQQLLLAKDTEVGARLVSSSYMEDKLVGDLLAMREIQLSDEDYYTFVRRRLFHDAEPVSIFANYFYPSKFCDIKLVHMDEVSNIDPIYIMKESHGLYPKKLWPSYMELDKNSLKYGKDNIQLELLSKPECLNILSDANLVVVSVVYNETHILQHFLDHYRSIGVKSFIFVDNLSTDGTREYLLAQKDVVLYSADSEYRHSHYGVAWQQAVLAAHCLGKWALVADADEFLVYPDCENTNIHQFVESLSDEGFDAARLVMVDMYPEGDLASADFTEGSPFQSARYYDCPPLRTWQLSKGYFSESVQRVSAFRHRIMPEAQPAAYTAEKTALFKYGPWVRLSEGLHFVSGVRAPNHLVAFAHFKYHAGFKLKADLEVKRKQHYQNADEYIKYKELISELQGGFFDNAISMPYIDSEQFISSLHLSKPFCKEK